MVSIIRDFRQAVDTLVSILYVTQENRKVIVLLPDVITRLEINFMIFKVSLFLCLNGVTAIRGFQVDILVLHVKTDDLKEIFKIV